MWLCAVVTCHVSGIQQEKHQPPHQGAMLKTLKKLLQYLSTASRAQAVKFITRCKLLWRRQCHAKPARYNDTLISNKRLSVYSQVFGNFHAHNLSTHHLSGFFWKKISSIPFYSAARLVRFKQKKHHKYFQYHFLRTTFPRPFSQTRANHSMPTPCAAASLVEHFVTRSLMWVLRHVNQIPHFSCGWTIDCKGWTHAFPMCVTWRVWTALVYSHPKFYINR